VFAALVCTSGLKAQDAAEQGILLVDSIPSGAAIYVEGQIRGVTPCMLTADEGSVRLKLVKRGYRENTRVEKMESGGLLRLVIKLEPETEYGTIMVAALPVGAAVRMDGKPAGKSPCEVLVTCDQEHLVEVEHPGFVKHERKVSVEAGKHVLLEPFLQKPGAEPERPKPAEAKPEEPKPVVAPTPQIPEEEFKEAMRQVRDCLAERDYAAALEKLEDLKEDAGGPQLAEVHNETRKVTAIRGVVEAAVTALKARVGKGINIRLANGIRLRGTVKSCQDGALEIEAGNKEVRTNVDEIAADSLAELAAEKMPIEPSTAEAIALFLISQVGEVGKGPAQIAIERAKYQGIDTTGLKKRLEDELGEPDQAEIKPGTAAEPGEKEEPDKKAEENAGVVLIERFVGLEAPPQFDWLLEQAKLETRTNEEMVRKEALEGVKAIAIFDPGEEGKFYRDGEVTAIYDFVRAGGGLLVVGATDRVYRPKREADLRKAIDDYPVNTLAKRFGVVFARDRISDRSNNVGGNPRMPVFHVLNLRALPTYARKIRELTFTNNVSSIIILKPKPTIVPLVMGDNDTQTEPPGAPPVVVTVMCTVGKGKAAFMTGPMWLKNRFGNEEFCRALIEVIALRQ